MTKENFNRIMAGLEEVRRHAAGEDVPGMVIHRPAVSEMVERVARALADRRYIHCGGADGGSLVKGRPNWTFCIWDAETAIGAMRGATEPMIASGIACAENCTDGWTAAAPCVAEHCWDAMIDEALKT